MTDAREELRRNEMFAEALQTRINSLTTDFVSRDDPLPARQDRRGSPEGARRARRASRARSTRGKKQIDDIEEEARKAGVPPGWLR